MVVKQNTQNQTNVENPLIDTGQVTVNAFNAIKNKEKTDKNFILGRDDDALNKSPNHTVKIKAWTQIDNKTHTYFHSLSIDVNVEDFMGTAELKCPYDSDLMEYWTPITQTVVIYGANQGDYKILFIGRVRELKQDGYELVITFQNYGWKFKQLVTQSYANDNVLNKDGYTIMRLMFEALKIDSYVISESAKNRLKQVGINEDGNLTLNGEELKEMPDLLKRLQESNPSKLINKDMLNNKIRESQLHNIKNINYTLKYEKPTPVMKKISSEGSFTAGSNVYENAYGSASSSGGSTGGTGGTGQGGVGGSGCNPPSVSQFCPSCQDGGVGDALLTIWKFNRNCVSDYSGAKNTIVSFANNHPATYTSQVKACLGTLSRYCTRSDGVNAASIILDAANNAAMYSGASKAVSNTLNSGYQAVTSGISYVVNTGISWAQQAYTAVDKGTGGLLTGIKNLGHQYNLW